MITSRLTRAVVAATALSSFAPLPHGAAAATDYATLTGTGSYSPGIPVTGCAFQSLTIDWTMVVVGDHAGTRSFRFDGSSDVCETPLAGSGSGTLSGSLNGDVRYSRTGNHVSYTGRVTVDGTPVTVTAWSCVRSYTSAMPATSFVDHCHAVFSP